MKELSCEDVLMAQMAAADGEEPEFSKQQLSTHIAGCANCQHELKQLQTVDQVLAGHALHLHECLLGSLDCMLTGHGRAHRRRPPSRPPPAPRRFWSDSRWRSLCPSSSRRLHARQQLLPTSSGLKDRTTQSPWAHCLGSQICTIKAGFRDRANVLVIG